MSKMFLSFSYIPNPAGSLEEIKRFRGPAPTGPLPEMVNFPLYKVKESKKFKAIVTGDTQVYNDHEINYLRNSLLKEVSGSWWSGDFDDAGIPISYMRCGTPRGHMVFSFDKNDYKDIYKAPTKPYTKQMNLSFLREEFMSWFDRITEGDLSATINDLEFRYVLTTADLDPALLVTNI